MRFLVGLFFGALVTLGVAALIDRAPTPGTRAVDAAENPLEAADARSDDSAAAQDLTDAAPFAPAETPIAAQDLAAAADRAFLEEPAAAKDPASAEDPASLEDPAAAEPVAAADAPMPPAAVTEPTRVSVWQPFHSEISAQGFAKRLTLQLGYPFEVIKAAPAEYHVVFSYVEDSQRELLSAQLAALTGRAPQ